MNKRQAKKVITRAFKLSFISWEMAELYLKRYKRKEVYRGWKVYDKRA